MLYSTEFKILWYWQRNKQVDQQNRIENSEKDPCYYAQLIFAKLQKQFNKGGITCSSWGAKTVAFYRQKINILIKWKNKPQYKSHTFYKNQLKINQWLKSEI